MPQRNSCKKNQLQNIILRRSPRSLPTKPPDPEFTLRRSLRFRKTEPHDSADPKTPFVEEQTRTRFRSPLVSTGRKRSTKTPKVQVSEKSNVERNREPGRRMTRSCRKDTGKIAKKIDYCDSTGNSSVCKTRECTKVSKSFKAKSLNNKVKENEKCRKDDCERDCEGVGQGKVNEEVLFVKECNVFEDGLLHKEIAKRVGVKRKRSLEKKDAGNAKGWTKEQELALERAYLTANPTPHFWKKVSRMVAGKSAQECFDKVHCSHLTPPQPRPRSRAVGLVSHNSNLSASKLLDSPFQKAKRPCVRKQKSHVLQRTVRHMLQKQSKVEKDSEADLFSVLEPTLCPPSQQLLTTPDCVKFKGVFPKKCHEGSSTAYIKSRSRFSSSYETPIISPPVLKQIKNMALHEKYIDQLNSREANRKAASLKEKKIHKSKGQTCENSVQRKEAVKVAKFALVFDAKDVINKFQDQQAKALSSIFDDEIGSDNEEELQDLF